MAIDCRDWISGIMLFEERRESVTHEQRTEAKLDTHFPQLLLVVSDITQLH